MRKILGNSEKLMGSQWNDVINSMVDQCFYIVLRICFNKIVDYWTMFSNNTYKILFHLKAWKKNFDAEMCDEQAKVDDF